MPTRTDIIQSIRIDEQNPNLILNTYLKGSDPPFGSPMLELLGLTVKYPDVMNNAFPLYASDPAQTYEPSYSSTETETERFKRYILLYATPIARVFLLHLHVFGTGHIYVDTGATTFYYKLYAKLVKTSNFTTFTDLFAEEVAMNYNCAGKGAAGWYDEGTISWGKNIAVSLNANEYLLLQLRGTSWASSTAVPSNSSIGLKSTNTKIYGLIFI